MNELVYVTQEQRDLILKLFGGVRREEADIAGLGSDEIDADYLSELRTSRNRWRREAKDLRAENARLRAVLDKVAKAHAQYAYAEPNYGVLLSLKEEARAALAPTDTSA